MIESIKEAIGIYEQAQHLDMGLVNVEYGDSGGNYDSLRAEVHKLAREVGMYEPAELRAIVDAVMKKAAIRMRLAMDEYRFL